MSEILNKVMPLMGRLFEMGLVFPLFLNRNSALRR